MYEFTHKGLWFRWSALDRPSRRWSGISLAAAALAAISIGLAADQAGYRVGYLLGGGRTASKAAPLLPSWAMLGWIIACVVVSALAWWRFSRRQDEMFNRVQNWSLGMAGAWTAVVLAFWSLLDLYDAASPIHPLGVIGIFYTLAITFWLVAVRRWA